MTRRPATMTRLHWLALACVVGLAVAARLFPWAQVFTPGGVRFVGDGDVYYHALRARVLAQDHRVLWRDPGLSYPEGADVPWPPLFDLLIAFPAWVAGGATPSNEVVERVAAFVPVVLAALGVLAATLLARELLGRRGALVCALVLASVPVHVSYSTIGRPDHHVLEALLFTALLSVYARALGRPERPPWTAALALGVVMTAAFWSWVGSVLYVAILCILVFAARVLTPRDGGTRAVRVVGTGTAVAVLLTGVTFGLLGPAGALGRVSLGSVSALAVLVAAGAALWCAALAAGDRLRPDASLLRRALEAVVAAAVVAGALLVVPSVRAAVTHGLAAAGHGGEWAFILETQPLFAPGASVAHVIGAVFESFGLLPLLAIAGVAELPRWWRAPERRPLAVFVAVLGLVFVALVVHMNRFGYYGAIPLSIFAAMGAAAISRAGSRYGPRVGPVLAAGAVFLVLVSTIPGIRHTANTPARLEGVARAVAPLGDGRVDGDGALLVRWDEGHHARYYSGRPVVASPFGSDIGRGAMADTAAFFLEEDPVAARALMERRGVRWIVIDDLPSTVLEAVAFAGSPNPPVTRVDDRARGAYIHCERSFDRLVAARLYYETGSASAMNPVALGDYRLVGEVGPRGGPATARLFEVVKGALVRLRGSRPGRPVVATATITTTLGQFSWRATAQSDALGVASMRLPFATGRNGTVLASAYVVSDGFDTSALAATDEQVLTGAHLEADLSPDGRHAAGPR